MRTGLEITSFIWERVITFYHPLILLNIWIKGMKMKIGVAQNPSIDITTFFD
jgi:hypothetical protein